MTAAVPPDGGVPLLDLGAQHAPLREAMVAAIARVVDSHQFILGPDVFAFEREMAAALEARHAIAVSSGTDALLVALMALGIGPGDEVLTPTYSFFATAGSVSRLGATPVFVDIDRDTYAIDVEAARRALTSRTKAIMPVHLFGLPVDMAPIMTLAAEAGLSVIEDAAQAIGARDRGRQVGTIGHVGAFSFFPSKNLGALGDAGLVTTNDDGLASEIRLLRNHGAEPKYHHARIGGNFRMDTVQAAVLRVKAPYLVPWTQARQRNADRYRSLFASRGLDRALSVPVERGDATHIYNQFVVRIPERDRVRAFLADRRIGTEIYYPVPFHRQACFSDVPSAAGAFPVADAAAATSLALPIYGELTLDQQTRVVDALADALGGAV